MVRSGIFIVIMVIPHGSLDHGYELFLYSHKNYDNSLYSPDQNLEFQKLGYLIQSSISSILMIFMGFSLTNHPAMGFFPILGNLHILQSHHMKLALQNWMIGKFTGNPNLAGGARQAGASLGRPALGPAEGAGADWLKG